MLNFSECGHLVFRGSSALERGALRSKGKGKLSFHFCGDDKTAELILRTIISVKQLNIYGAEADMCDELACRIYGCSESTGNLVAQNNSETIVIPTGLSMTNKTLKGNLPHDYEQNFANLPDHLQLIKLCSNGGITKTVAKGQDFTTRDDAELDKLVDSCREFSLLRDNTASKVKGWIRGSYGIEIMINSSLGDGICSWVMIVNGKNKYVTEMTEETQENRVDDIGDSTGKLVAKARPNQTSMPTTASPTVTLPYQVRQMLFRSVRKRSNSFERILQFLEMKTEQSNSESWHRCFVQNLRPLRIGQFQHG